MADGFRGSDRRLELVDVIRRVRNRWRLKLVLRGTVIVVGGTLLVLLLSASSLEALRFSPAAIVSFRIAALIIFGLLAYEGFVRPLRRRVTDSQVALYLEESDPSLQAAILSAVESSSSITEGAPETGPSPRLVERLIEQALERCGAIEDGLAVERPKLRRHAYTLAGLATVAALLVTLGPAYLRHGLSALLIVSRSAVEAIPYLIKVQPGHAKIPRDSDQEVKAELFGFTAGEANLMFRSAPDTPFERAPLAPGADPTSFQGVLFHVEKQTEYYVESNGVKSPTFSLTVMDLPTVKKLVLQYHFPAYTGLEPRTIDPGGDIAVIKGTEVHVKVTPTMATPAGSVLLNQAGSAALTKQADGTLTGAFKVGGQGFYRIKLEGPQAEKVNASPQYTIDVLTDQTPSVAFSKPGRDTRATAVEEVFAEVRADDDFGVKQVQLFYSVNGDSEKTVHLFGGSKALPEVTASHTLYLEELGLKPGDFVSYYAKASDNDAVQGSKTTTSDIYFVQIRPFRTDFKPAPSAGGGGGGGAVGQLSWQQREIVAATFNTVRDRPKMSADKFRENTVFLTLAQARLREQVEELSEKMNSRLDVVDPAFKSIAEALPKAAAEMKSAEADLKVQNPKEALSPEQRALKLLQVAEQQYELQVQAQRGGGGGRQNQLANDLADLFELELDKLTNQYEMQQRADMQGADRKVDELVERLKELARRQQQEAERQRRLAASSSSASGGGDLQRQLAQEVEEAVRRLQQLTREERRHNLTDATRQLQEAVNAMRQAAAANGRDGGAQARAALGRLREAQRRLQQNQTGRAERDVQEALRRAEELVDEQRQVASEVDALEQQPAAARPDRAQAIAERKDAMDAEVAGLQSQLEEVANEARSQNDRAAARKLDEAAGSITDKRIREMIRYTRRALRTAMGSDYAQSIEAQIGTNLDGLRQKITDAQAALGQATKENALGRAVDETRDAVRGLESLGQRMRDRAQQNQQRLRGQQGQGGQQQGQGGQQADSHSAAGGGATGGVYFGGPYGGGRTGDARSWGFWGPDDVRRFRRDFREWRGDVKALRRDLLDAGIDPRELDAILRDLRQFDTDQAFVDPRSLAALQASALERMKAFEFGLRKNVNGVDQPPTLSGSDEIPASFRQAIEEYYRSLAKKQ